MKQLISATLSEEAARIYNNWEKQKKSKILSDIIVVNDSILQLSEARKKQIGDLQVLLSRAMIEMKQEMGLTPLVQQINERLSHTIYYQYWDHQETS